jgi:hypothetical protein
MLGELAYHPLEEIEQKKHILNKVKKSGFLENRIKKSSSS